MPLCPRCAGLGVKKDGRDGETQRYRCRSCRRTFIARTGTPFAGHRWPQEVIVTAVRWYLRFRLSAADVRDMLAERGVDVSARTVLYWVQKFAPLLARAGRRAATRPGTRWWCDETYVRVGLPLPCRRRAGAGHRRVAARAPRPGQRAGVLRPGHRPPPGSTRRGDHRQAPGLCPRHPRGDVRGRAHAERAAPQERTRHQAGRAVPCADEGPPATDARAAVAPHRQRTVEGVELARAVQRGDVAAPQATVDNDASPHTRARAAATTFTWLADGLRVAA